MLTSPISHSIAHPTPAHESSQARSIRRSGTSCAIVQPTTIVSSKLRAAPCSTFSGLAPGTESSHNGAYRSRRAVEGGAEGRIRPNPSPRPTVSRCPQLTSSRYTSYCSSRSFLSRSTVSM